MTKIRAYMREKPIEALISEHQIPYLECAEASVHLAKEGLNLFAFREEFVTRFFLTETECLAVLGWNPLGVIIIHRAKTPLFALLLRMVMTIIEEMATEVKNPLDVLNQALDIELFEESETEEKTENSLIACDTEEQLHDVLDDDDIETESIEDDSEWI